MNELDLSLYSRHREKEVAAYIAKVIAKELQKEPSAIDINTPFQDFGLESIFYLELIGDLAEWIEVDIPETIFMDETTILGVANRLTTYVENGSGYLPGLDYWQPIAQKHGLDIEELRILGQSSLNWAKGQERHTFLALQATKTEHSIPIFWFLSGTTGAEEITQSTPKQSTYILPAGWTDINHSERFVKALANYYIEEIKRINPGPIIEVGGFCRGAKVALETARLLEKNGFTVRKLYLFDSIGPYPNREKISMRHHNWRKLINQCIRKIHPSLRQLKNKKIFLEEWFYQPEPISIPTLIIACRNSFFYAKIFPLNGWDHIIKGQKELTLIPGSHASIGSDQATKDGFKIAITEHRFK
jgi:acyl carrier protein